VGFVFLKNPSLLNAALNIYAVMNIELEPLFG